MPTPNQKALANLPRTACQLPHWIASAPCSLMAHMRLRGLVVTSMGSFTTNAVSILTLNTLHQAPIANAVSIQNWKKKTTTIKLDRIVFPSVVYRGRESKAGRRNKRRIAHRQARQVWSMQRPTMGCTYRARKRTIRKRRLRLAAYICPAQSLRVTHRMG